MISKRIPFGMHAVCDELLHVDGYAAEDVNRVLADPQAPRSLPELRRLLGPRPAGPNVIERARIREQAEAHERWLHERALVEETPPKSCHEGGSCVGSPCASCDYPKAYANRDTAAAAGRCDEVVKRGLAGRVVVDAQVPIGIVHIVYRTGRRSEHHVDLLDVEIDGITVRDLIARDEMLREERPSNYRRSQLTPAQRTAVSAHWSAELRAKVAASAAADLERERNRVRVDLEYEGYE